MESMESEFERLSRQWKRDTEMLSSVDTVARHPAYQRIIAMGDPVVPLILSDLKQHPGTNWFWALTAITGQNPITEKIAGHMHEMADAWLRLGDEKGWLKN